ncbi:MAG TPA: hypothetical protein VEJ89_02750 [Myxococcaceae bacterium]|nr:hypothetical protein [Myxococcaceae bacterium]
MPPPTAAQIQALAVRERVPARIARGELEGKMKARVWRKLHPEEARRFDEAYQLVARTPGLPLDDAFALLQSGLSLEELRTRRARTARRDDLRSARRAVAPEAIDGWLEARLREKAPLALVLADRTVLDVLDAVQPLALLLERTGRVEKLHLILLTRAATWDQAQPTLSRDARLAQRPVPVAREPDRRPVSDPRPLLGHVDETVRFQLRNGLQVERRLLAVGPYDVLVGASGEELLVPLHALMSWTATEPSAAP